MTQFAYYLFYLTKNIISMNIFNTLRCLFMALYLLTKVLISLTEFGRALLSCSLPHIVKLYNGCNADRAGSCWLKYSDIHSGKTDVPLYLFDGKQLFSTTLVQPSKNNDLMLKSKMIMNAFWSTSLVLNM